MRGAQTYTELKNHPRKMKYKKIKTQVYWVVHARNPSAAKGERNGFLESSKSRLLGKIQVSERPTQT